MSHERRTIPHTELYWAELDTSVLPQARRRDPVRLGYLFESVLPCPIDTVHAVYAHQSPSRAIACGIDRERLDEYRSDAVTLRPDWLPTFLDGADHNAFNLLVGEYEPDPVRVLRRRWMAWSSAALLVVTGVISLGIERRVMQERRVQDRISERSDQIYSNSFGEEALRRQPAPALLVAELRRLRATRADSPEVTEEDSAALVLSRFLRDWPTTVKTRTESIEATGGAVRVSMLLDDTESAERFRSAYAEEAGWVPDGHQNVDRVREDVRLTMRVTPAGEESP